MTINIKQLKTKLMNKIDDDDDDNDDVAIDNKINLETLW